MTAAIETARKKGFEDGVILNKVKEKFPNLTEKIDEAQKRGIDDTSILNHIQEKELAKQEPKMDLQRAVDLGFVPGKKSPELSPIPGHGISPKEPDLPVRDIGILEALQEGFSESTLAIPTGQFPDLKELQKRAATELSFFDTLVKGGAMLASDLPAMVIGGGVGSVLGGTAGTAVAPGPGTAIGATAGGGAGAFAMPTLIRSAYIEYLEAQDKPEDMTFGEWIEATGRVVKETGVSAAIGATVALNPIFGALKKIPGMGKLLNTTGKESAVAFGTEVGTLTGLQAAEEGKAPDPRDLALNTLIIGGMKLSKAGQSRLRRVVADRIRDPAAEAKTLNNLTPEEAVKVATSKNMREATEIIETANARAKSESKAALQEKVTEPKAEKRPQTVEEQISDLREANPGSFKKDGELRKNAKAEVRKQFEGLLEEAKEGKLEVRRPTDQQPVGQKTPKEAEIAVTKPKLQEIRQETINTLKQERTQLKQFKEANDVQGINKSQEKIAVLEQTLRQNTKLSQELETSGQEAIKAPKGLLATGEIPPAKGPLDTGALPIEAGKGKAPKRREIIQSLDEAIGPIRQGGVTVRKAAGQFSEETGVIRTKGANDIEVVSHEVGHKIHAKMYGDKVNEKLRPFTDELKPIARYAPYKKEGFAEFTRMYVTNPEKAKEAAPRFFKHFESELDKNLKGVKENLLEARESYKQYRTADPESRVRSQLEFSEDKNIIRRTADWLNKNVVSDKIKSDWLDDMFVFKRVVADLVGIRPVDVENWESPLNVYFAARVLKGSAGRAEAFLEHETFDFNLKENGKSFLKIMEPLKTRDEWRNLSTYMTAKRALEKDSQGFKTGIHKKDANVVVKKYHKEYEPVRKELLEYQDRLLQYFRDSGLISGETYKSFKAKNREYVPFYRFFNEGERSQASGFTKGIEAKMPIKGFKGSERNILDPLESIVKNTSTLMELADRNRVGQILVKLAKAKGIEAGRFVEELPGTMKSVAEISRQEMVQRLKSLKNKGELTIDDVAMSKLATELPEKMSVFRASSFTPQENSINVWFEGKAKSYRVSPELYRAFKDGMNPMEASILEKVMAAPARLLRASAILNPRFMQKNIVRDWLGGAVFTKAHMNPFYDPIRGIASAYKKDKLYVEWLKSGGAMSTMQSIDSMGLAKRLGELRSQNLSVKDGLIHVRDKAGQWQPIKTMRWLAEITEEANRLAEFQKALKNDSSRIGKEIAAFRSRDLSIDFAKVGIKAKAINRIIPFWNATIQGTDKLARTLAQGGPEAKQAAIRGLLGITLPSLMLSIVNDGDPDLADETEESKDFNFMFKVGDDIYKIPVPFETGLILHGTTRRFYEYAIKNDPKAFEGFLLSLVQGTMPGVTPQAIKPLVEAWANKDFFRDRAIVPRATEGLVSELQFNKYTSETAKQLSKIMSYMPGVDELEGKWTSPAVIEHFINSWTSSWGRLSLAVLDEGFIRSGILDIPPRPERSLLEKLGFDAFKVRSPSLSKKSIEEFYDNYNKSKKLKRSIKQLAEERDIPRAQQLQRIDTFPKLDRAYQVMQRMQKSVNLIWKDENMTAKEKKIFIDDHYNKMLLFAREVNKQVEKYKLDREEQQAQNK